MPYKLRGNKRRSSTAYKKDLKYYNKNEKWEKKKKHKRRIHHAKRSAPTGLAAWAFSLNPKVVYE